MGVRGEIGRPDNYGMILDDATFGNRDRSVDSGGRRDSHTFSAPHLRCQLRPSVTRSMIRHQMLERLKIRIPRGDFSRPAAQLSRPDRTPRSLQCGNQLLLQIEVAHVRNKVEHLAIADEKTRRLEPILRRHPSRYWLDGLEPLNVSSGPINTIDQVFDHPQVRHREMEIEMRHPLAGDAPVRLIASPIRMSATPPTYRHPPPTLGQSTDEVLKELLGMGDEELAALRQRGVI